MLSTKNTSSYTFFFFNDTATTEIYTLSLHDALPISVPALLDPLVPDEQREHRRGRGHRDERPGGPAELAALHEGVEQQQQRDRDQADADRVQLGRAGRPGFADEHGRGRHRDDPDRHVDQEDRPPAEAEQVVLDEQPADERPADRAQARRHPDTGQRLDPLRRREDNPAIGPDLRNHALTPPALPPPRSAETGRGRLA